MTSMVFLLMMQFLVSTKAGLVNYVQGTANVKATMNVPAGMPIETGANGAVEVLLNPGSFLRLGEDSAAVLDQVELEGLSLQITRGSAVIEASGFDKNFPLKVATGKLKLQIIRDGVYTFSNGKVRVVEGRIMNAATGSIYNKGAEVSDDEQGYRVTKFKGDGIPLEIWSRKRSEMIAAANTNIARSLRNNPNVPFSSFLNVWLWAPAFGGFVYMPGYRYHSPYGYRYVSVGEYYGGGSSSASSGGGSGNPEASRGGGATSSGSEGGFGGGGGGFGGGGIAAGPAAPRGPEPAPQPSGGHSSPSIR